MNLKLIVILNLVQDLIIPLFIQLLNEMLKLVQHDGLRNARGVTNLFNSSKIGTWQM